jgi:hypothetical protein
MSLDRYFSRICPDDFDAYFVPDAKGLLVYPRNMLTSGADKATYL